MYTLQYIKQGIKYAKSSLKLRLTKRKPTGTAKQICENLVKQNWNGKHYTTSTNHYKEFWARDTGLTADSLIKLGHKERLIKTMKYALETYKKHGSITTTISRERKPFNFPNLYSPDSVAMFTYTASKAGIGDKLFQTEADRFATKVLDDKGFIKKDKFSSMRDYAVQKSSCYNHCISILMAKTCKKMGLKFPYSAKELSKNLQKYWTGEYYKDALEDETCTGDANTFPYLAGAGKHFGRALKTVQKLGLDQPFPLAYTAQKQKMRFAEKILVPGWQQDAIWPMMGLLFIKIVKEHNKKKAEEYKQKYTEIIERYGTLYEVYTKKAEPYKSLFYHADAGMIWAGNYLTIQIEKKDYFERAKSGKT